MDVEYEVDLFGGLLHKYEKLHLLHSFVDSFDEYRSRGGDGAE